MLILSFATGNGFVILLLVCAAVIGAYRIQAAMKLGELRDGASGNLRRVQSSIAEWKAFTEDPNRGLFLQRAWQEHPLLFQEPIPQPESAAPAQGNSTYVERQLVERQVVVTRCKFCKQMTPVDAHACHHCGAPGFAS